MINQVKLRNFGPLRKVEWSKLGRINLVIGNNGSGKTFLLKAIYCSLRTLEMFRRGNEQRSAPEILANKLYWTFQTPKIGDLVSKGADEQLSSSSILIRTDSITALARTRSSRFPFLREMRHPDRAIPSSCPPKRYFRCTRSS